MSVIYKAYFLFFFALEGGGGGQINVGLCNLTLF